MAPCTLCPSSPARAILRRPKTLQPVCKSCFFEVFETEIHNTIMGFGQAEGSGSGKGKGKELFRRGERVAIGASGGKGEWRSCSGLLLGRAGRWEGTGTGDGDGDGVVGVWSRA